MPGKNNGTPQNVDELVRQIVTTPGRDLEERTAERIIEYIRNRASPAILKAGDDSKMVVALESLVAHMTVRGPK